MLNGKKDDKMSRLNKKLFRDIRKNLSQFITVFLMIFLGVLVYSGIRSYMTGMQETADIFYKDYNLQKLNLVGQNFDDESLNKIKEIDGIKDAERKLTVRGGLENKEEVTLEINFIESNKISKFYIVDGAEFSEEKSGVWLSEYFAQNNDLKVGDTINIKYNEIVLEKEILGIINVPDHVYSAKDLTEVFPNHKDYGFCYMHVKELPMQIVPFTQVMIETKEDVKLNDLKRDLEDKIDSISAVIDIEDTSSYSSYQTEIEEGKTYAGVFTVLFLLIAILSVITTMTRIVKKQRIQIGTLKALGFKKGKITKHYVGYSFWISIIAVICGIFTGPETIGKMFIEMEMRLFQIPNGHQTLENSSFVIAAFIVFIVCFVTYLTCRKVLKQNTAETLRTELPKVKNTNIMSNKLVQKLNFSGKWNIRDILRNKLRTGMGIVRNSRLYDVTCLCFWNVRYFK